MTAPPPEAAVFLLNVECLDLNLHSFSINIAPPLDRSALLPINEELSISRVLFL